MRRSFQLSLPARVACRVVAAVMMAGAVRTASGAVPATPNFYDDIKPLLAVHCYKCHGPETSKGGLRLDRRDRAFAKGDSGSPAISPGHGEQSELLRRVTSQDPDERMPPKGDRLTADDIGRIRLWIEGGAKWPDKDDYWAFRPPTPPAVPVVTGQQPANPIDAFIDARLAEEKLTPAPRADARTLLRRAYADLLGVPPTPAEAEAFLSDRSPDAWEKLIDRLLADPRYGERWARHWLDLVRYGESDGFEDDKIRPHAWRYRDYVVRSLNDDKSYDRFVREQIAGDELWPDDPDAWVATGFARLGMWDGMSKDPPRQRQDFLNDATDAVGAVFLGMTVGCARCHDHKYDRITQRDYYALQAFFANVAREPHPLPGDPHDPPHVTAAFREANAEAKRLGDERSGIMAEAREQVAWDNRCDVDENAKVRVTDQQVARQAERLRRGRVGAIDARLKELARTERLNEPLADAISETSASAPTTVLLKGGELGRPGPEVAPAFVEAMCEEGSEKPTIAPARGGTSSGRRTALANWLASPQNPLTSRVLVNRLWQHHFGRGIVATPSDFGRHGQRPTHPELLDWLACRFVSDGRSLKRMHKLMMTSAAYQRASTADPAALAIDPENKLLWRMSRRRLEAEALRDSMLAVSGDLSPVRGGPGVYPPIPKGVNVELPNNDKELSWYACTEEEARRRSVYTFQRRSLTYPLVDVFDGAPMNQSCPVRAQTTVAPQALALFNGEFARQQAHRLAERVRREGGEGDAARVRRVFSLALVREPTADELCAALAFLRKQADVRAEGGAKATGAAALSLDDFCQVILNTNEFIYLD